MQILAVTTALVRLAESGVKQEAPNPILPATNEIIWGGLSFLVLLFVMWKYAMPALQKVRALKWIALHSLVVAEKPS